MLLRLRLAILLFAAVILLLLVFSGVLWVRQQHFDEYMHQQFLLESEASWARVETSRIDLLKSDADKILSSPEVTKIQGSNENLLYGASVPLLSQDPQKHGGIYNQRYGFINIDGSHDGGKDILTLDLYRQVIQSKQPLQGIDLLDLDNLVFWYATPFPHTDQVDPTVLMLAYNIQPSLEAMRPALNADVFMLDLHRQVLAGTDMGVWNQINIAPFLREKNVFRTRQAGKEYMIGVIPLQSYDHHPVSALVIVRDVTDITEREFLFTLVWVSLCVLLIVLLTTHFFFYIRHALRPIEKAVDVLDKLSKGDHSEPPDFGENGGQDEAGKITTAVSALRDEMITLDSLREEKVRQRRRQEALIRDKLLSLADTLDEAARAEIVQELDQVFVWHPAESITDHNELAGLAAILGRMSSLISSQQNRLLLLLRELHEAIEGKARLASLQQELEIARNMQLSILPRNIPLPLSVTVAATMIPAKEVGGDFYDYFMLDDQHLAIVVADVSGKGVPAAFFMAISRTLLKANALFLHSPAACINRLNQSLCLENEQMMFVTTFYGVLNLQTGDLVYVNAGHNPPVKLDAAYRATFLPYTKGVPLAVVEDFSYQEEMLKLQAGESIVLYTDGVTDALNEQEELFGEARFQAVLENIAEADRNKIPECVIQALSLYSEGVPQADDITCVALQFWGNAPHQHDTP
jgi:sigma-B regulation protein RsbU (phosphoserine phosphatase)